MKALSDNHEYLYEHRGYYIYSRYAWKQLQDWPGYYATEFVIVNPDGTKPYELIKVVHKTLEQCQSVIDRYGR